MKKIFAIALALMLVMSMGTSAFAAEYVEKAALDAADSSTSFDINGKIVESNEDVSVIAVDVSYGAMRFVFSKDSSGQLWNPTTHNYDGEESTFTGGAWFAENDSNYVTITNHSNVAVDVKLEANTNLTYDNDGGTGTVNVAISNEDGTANFTNVTEWMEVKSAEGTAIDAAPEATYSLMLTGSGYDVNNPFYNIGTDILTDEFKAIGSVTVSIKEASLDI